MEGMCAGDGGVAWRTSRDGVGGGGWVEGSMGTGGVRRERMGWERGRAAKGGNAAFEHFIRFRCKRSRSSYMIWPKFPKCTIQWLGSGKGREWRF